MKQVSRTLLTLILILSLAPMRCSSAEQHKRASHCLPPSANHKGEPRTSVPSIASILGLRVGWNGRDRLERRFGEGIYSIGGHSNGVETWYTRSPAGAIVTEGFCYNKEGEVLERIVWSLGHTARARPLVKHLPRHAGWLGVIYPGMTERQVRSLLADRDLPRPTKKDGVWRWTAKGFVRPSPVNYDVYDTWTALLVFQRGLLVTISIECEGGLSEPPSR